MSRRAPNPRLGVVVVCAAVFVSAATATLVNVVLPTIAADLGAATTEIGWTVTVYFLVYATGIPIYGKLADIHGIRPLYLFGMGAFATGAVVCAAAPNLGLLLVGRFVQGLGGAALPGLSMTAVAHFVPEHRRGGSIGAVAAAAGSGAAIGPILGGFGAQALGWRMLFLSSAITLALLAPLAARVLPRREAAMPDATVDLFGGVLLAVAAASALLGVTRPVSLGGGPWPTVVPLTVAAAATGWLVRRSGHVADPFVPPAIIRDRAFRTVTGVAALGSFTVISAQVMVPLLLDEVSGLGPAPSGLVLTPMAIAVAALSIPAGRLASRWGPRRILLSGLLVMAASFGAAAVAVGASAVLMALALFGVGVGFGLVSAPAAAAVAARLQPAELGAGLGLQRGVLFMASAAGPALLGAVLAVRGSASGRFGSLDPSGAAAYVEALVLCGVIVLSAAVWLYLSHRSRAAKPPSVTPRPRSSEPKEPTR